MVGTTTKLHWFNKLQLFQATFSSLLIFFGSCSSPVLFFGCSAVPVLTLNYWNRKSCALVPQIIGKIWAFALEDRPLSIIRFGQILSDCYWTSMKSFGFGLYPTLDSPACKGQSSFWCGSMYPFICDSAVPHYRQYNNEDTFYPWKTCKIF